jgi:hypothetical protein
LLMSPASDTLLNSPAGRTVAPNRPTEVILELAHVRHAQKLRTLQKMFDIVDLFELPQPSLQAESPTPFADLVHSREGELLGLLPSLWTDAIRVERAYQIYCTALYKIRQNLKGELGTQLLSQAQRVCIVRNDVDVPAGALGLKVLRELIKTS